MSNTPSHSLPLNESDEPAASLNTTPAGSEEVRWEIVARTSGLMPATIIAGRLTAENIPARAWQEGAGRALGLTVGILGTGYVAVPAEYESQARQILAETAPDDWDEEE